ncbi:MAG: class I SAM-dependent methyltransferase [Patescibacteria group bacterium]
MIGYNSDYSKIYSQSSDAGLNYNKRIGNRFENFIFDLEKYFLVKIFNDLQNQDKNYLDFACGTGRIIRFISQNFRFRSYIGYDLSPQMVEEAQKSIKSAEVKFIVGDITKNGGSLPDDYFELVTAFRLILNLEPNNRLNILRALHNKLSSDGYLVVNNHMNRYSLMGVIAWLLHQVMRWPLKNDLAALRLGRRRIISTMSQCEVRKLLDETGFKIIKIYHFTFFPGYKNFVILPPRILFYVELFISSLPLVNYFTKDQIYVCVKKN